MGCLSSSGLGVLYKHSLNPSKYRCRRGASIFLPTEKEGMVSGKSPLCGVWSSFPTHNSQTGLEYRSASRYFNRPNTEGATIP